jgi:Aldo/keto reductase family
LQGESRDTEREVLPTCEELEVGFVPWSPLGQGFLTAKIDASTKFESTDPVACPNYPFCLRALPPAMAFGRVELFSLFVLNAALEGTLFHGDVGGGIVRRFPENAKGWRTRRFSLTS